MPNPNRSLDEDLHPVQLKILRSMSECERVALWNDLTRTTLEMSFVNLQERYPDASPRELKYRFARLDLILSKLEWYELGNRVSERQWKDLLGILKVQEALDWDYLRKWANQLGLLELLNKAQVDAAR